LKQALILYSSSSTACGIGTWIDALSQSLKVHQWDVTVGLAWGEKFHDPAKVEAFRPGLKTIRMDARTGTEEGRIQAIERAVREINPNVIILTVLHAAFEAARRLRFSGKQFRLVAVNHGNLSGQAACLLENSDVIDMAVCVSRLSYLAMLDLPCGFLPERLRYISNSVPIPQLDSKSKHAFRVGYVGRLDADKRAEDIIPFFSVLHELCPEVQMWVAGKGASEGWMRDLANMYPQHFFYCGEMSRKKLESELYTELDILVHFSPSEAWGYSIAEAMSFGVVPVVSAFRGIHTDGLVIEGDNSLIFPIGDYKRAAELVASLCENQARLGELGLKARQHIAQKFSLSIFGEMWSDALNACLELPDLPVLSRPASLDEKGPVGLPWPIWERFRRLMRRQVFHSTPGEEWPHFKYKNKDLMQKVEQSMRNLDAGKQEKW